MLFRSVDLYKLHPWNAVDYQTRLHIRCDAMVDAGDVGGTEAEVLNELATALVNRRAPFHRLQSLYLPPECESARSHVGSVLDKLRRACLTRRVEIFYEETAVVSMESLMSPKFWRAHLRARG